MTRAESTSLALSAVLMFLQILPEYIFYDNAFTDNQSFLRNLNGVLSEESKKVLKDCFTVVKNTRERLHNIGLHLLMEVPVLDTMHQLSGTNIEEGDQDYEATVVFSKTVDFT